MILRYLERPVNQMAARKMPLTLRERQAVVQELAVKYRVRGTWTATARTSPIRYAQFAAAMGAYAARVKHLDEVGVALRGARASERPGVLEIMVDPAELFEPFRREALKVPVPHLVRYE